MKKIISALLVFILTMTYGTCLVLAQADIKQLEYRQPVNTVRVSEEIQSLRYSNTGYVWKDIPFVQIGDICYFNTVDARLLSAGGMEIRDAMYLSEQVNPYIGGFDDTVETFKQALLSLDDKETLSVLDGMEKQLISMSNNTDYKNDSMYSRYDVMKCRKQIEELMERRMENQFFIARKAIQDCIANQFIYTQSVDDNVLNYCSAIAETSAADGILWDDIKELGNNSSALTSMYRRIFLMAQAYQCESSRYCKDDMLLSSIKTALDTADKYWYNSQVNMYTNWWDFMIGVPESYSKTLAIVWEELSGQEQTRYASALEYFCRYEAYSGVSEKENESQAGANLVNISNYDYIMGVLTQDMSKTERAVKKFYSVFEYNMPGSGLDGFYEDGSFLQHGVPYNGSYGREFLQGVVDMAESLNGTKWGFSDEHYTLINEWIDNGYIPFVFRSCMMDMVNGRAIVRNYIDKQYGYQVGRVILHYANILKDVQKKKEYCETVKYWFTTSSDTDRITWRTNCDPLSVSIMENDTYKAVDHSKRKTYVYSNMDRIVHRPCGEWAVGIGFYSSRIPSYELTNGENLKGWYTGAGAVYLYNENDTQYTDNYWITADMYSIAGTTADSTVRYSDGEGEHYQNGDAEGYSGCDFVGGIEYNDVGLGAMEFEQIDADISNLTAKKSYFMFPEGVLCIGSNINGGNGEVYTTIENRAVESSKCSLAVNGEDHGFADMNMEDVQTVNLSGACGEIGYYFPNKTRLEFKYVLREGSQSDVKYNGSQQITSKNFFTIKKHHGENPSDEFYSYMILPGKSAAETIMYAEDPDVRLLCASDEVHAVCHRKTKKTAAAFYSEGAFTMDDGTKIVSNSPLLMIIDEEGNMVLCDITGKLTSAEITISKEINYSESDDVEIVYGDSGTLLKINFSDKKRRPLYVNKVEK